MTCSIASSEEVPADPLFDFRPSEPGSLPKIEKKTALRVAGIQEEARLSRKRFKMRKDKRAIHHGHVQDSSLKWGWGQRRGIKYDRSQDDLLIVATHTHFHSRSYAGIEKEGKILPLWYPVESPKVSENGHASRSKWRLDVDIADVEVGRLFSFGSAGMRPYFGARSTFLHQKFEVAAEKQGPLESPGGNNCFALGTRGGIDSSWQLGKGFCFFGDSALSWLLGYRGMSERYDSAVKGNAGTGIAVLECSLGAAYEKIFVNSLSRFTVRTGYELNHFFNQEHWGSWFGSVSGEARERMSLEGLSCSFCLDF